MAEPSEPGQGPSSLPEPESQPNHMETPPKQLFAENSPVAFEARASPDGPNPSSSTAATNPNPSFAAQANEMINNALSREPVGTSVVEPDSVLGENGRLYHGYNEGKYFLPNDAVSVQHSSP
jgi:hypothetical protein